ncbi:MAG: hypothetical protein H6715_01670 [Myxococcales bacterium]|nr:hypothetical protein [Myxococcales bacterium]MCB9709005.1 hypothetical protein [Myxococcales bacterium]
MTVIGEKDKRSIESAIAQAEEAGRAEIVVAWAKRSDSYAAWRALGTGLLTLSAIFVIRDVHPALSMDWLLLMEVPIALLCWGVCGLPVLLRLMVPLPILQRAVHRRAMRTFLEAGVAQTEKRTGVLIFVSELERRVEIVADRGIHEHMGTQGWQAHVESIVSGIQHRQTAQAICGAIHSIGEEIHKVIAPTPRNPNELPNRVLYVD